MRSKDESRTRFLFAACVAALLFLHAGAPVGGTAQAAAGAAGPPAAIAADGGGENAMAGEPAAKESRFVVYYFHGARRCRTCRTIEAYAEEVVRSRFAEQLNSGALEWRAVNYDEPENEHFIRDFGLVSSSLVIVEMQAAEPVRFSVLQQAWSLVRDKPGFDRYVHQSILDYMDRDA